MRDKFKMTINNAGIINDAEIDIGQINVIGGRNASGKSISSKFLFCFLTALSKHGTYIDNNSIKDMYIQILKSFQEPSINLSIEEHVRMMNELNLLFDTWDDEKIQFSYFDGFYEKFSKILSEYNMNTEYVNMIMNSIRRMTDLHKDPLEHYRRVLRSMTNFEFGISQIKNFNGSNINFEGFYNTEKIAYEINFDDDKVEINLKSNKIHSSINGNILYIDSPSLFDFDVKTNNNYNEKYVLTNKTYHNDYLIRCLMKNDENKHEQNIFSDVIDEEKNYFLQKFIKLLDGDFEYDSSEKQFVYSSNEKQFELQNVASGYKQIGILEVLLKNNYLSRDTILIIDEPEINLHPYLQIKFMELLVNMSKKMNVTLYINSHSPYIIEALEVFSKKEEIENVNFYLCEENDDKYDIKKIDSEEVDLIYKNLSSPYGYINDIRFELNWNEM